MPNPIYNMLGGNALAGGNFGQILQQFRQFKSQFSGDPREQVQALLNSGRMTQSQYNELQNLARQFMSLM